MYDHLIFSANTSVLLYFVQWDSFIPIEFDNKANSTISIRKCQIREMFSLMEPFELDINKFKSFSGLLGMMLRCINFI